tara:strand:+ start:661 stop:1662 length:1002 start_codon:yes stop_codon:yes gene_type:complete
MKKKKLLIIDGFNTFLRSFAVNPASTDDGRPVGGTVGFLGSLRYLLNTIKPDKVIVAWDQGQSAFRKSIYPDYKANRKTKPRKVLLPFDDLDQQDESFGDQLNLLDKYMKFLPVSEIKVPSVEADDLIAYFCTSDVYGAYQKIIYSTDKDFFQLIGEDVVVYHPTKKKYLTEENILRDYGVYPWNFPVLRSLTGDPSDNIFGIKGVGFQNAKKYFPLLLGESRVLSTNDVIEYCENQVNEERSKYKAHLRVLEDPEKIKINYKLMQLIDPDLSPTTLEKMKWFNGYADLELEFSSLKLRMLFVKDKIYDLIEGFDGWITPFKELWYRMGKHGK